MTTIDERLEDILLEVFSNGRDELTSDFRVDPAKVAIRTLFLDLIAEAKPEILANANGPVTLGDCQRGLDSYENNLIQAINGGKK